MDNKGQDNSTKKVIIGLTGRVASSVAAFLLKKQGFQVIGMSIVTNVNDNFEDKSFFPKCHIEDLDKIKEFCNSLKIPFYATDAKARFEGEVIDPLLANKLIGNSNSSCFNCTEMRIKVMYEKMKKLNADYIATGHFCKVHQNIDSSDYFVHSNNDPESDQSFLLANVHPKYLKHLILPLGELRAIEVDKISAKFNLDLASHEIKEKFCFKEKGSYEFFIKKRVPKSLINEGQILNLDTENYQGDHTGMINHYVTEKDIEMNGTIPVKDADLEVVGFDFEKSILQVGSSKHLSFKGTQLIKLRLNDNVDKSKPIECFVKNKYNNKMIQCFLFFKNNRSAQIELDEEVYPVIEGEVFAIFDKDSRNAKVIGRGIVGKRGSFKLLDRVEDFKKKNEKNSTESNPFKF